ncbi:hypothetical protein ACHAW6_016208 [Cyclotella cf. meneghiniana]
MQNTLRTMRMSTRRSRSSSAPIAAAKEEQNKNLAAQDDVPTKSFTFDNESFYATYQEMVAAKRRRNLEMLIQSGLVDAKAAIDSTVAAKRASPAAMAKGIKRSNASEINKNLPRRKSSRLSGESAPKIFVESESGGRIQTSGIDHGMEEVIEYEPQYYNGRVNDGSPLTIEHAVKNCGVKWINDDGSTMLAANQFVETLSSVVSEYSGGQCNASPTTVTHSLQKDVDALSLDDGSNVAKVTPDRIYSVECHPSPHCLIVCAGDKLGYLGIWNVDQYNTGSDESSKRGKISTNDGVHLFKPHSAPISTLSWNESGSKLFSCSYDGTVRILDVEKQVFQEVFATYNDEDIYKDKIGFGLDTRFNTWVQCMELDHRHGRDGNCFFLSTSEGNVLHIDTRAKGQVTLNQKLSEKKINTVSLHPNGYTMATAGLDTTVKLWDIRKMSRTSNKIHKTPIASQNAGKSINSAYFSPSGKRIVTTTMANTIDILEDAHLASGLITKPKTRIRHDNMTGRWLSTFMAKWHPSPSTFSDECFVVGSMVHPRTIEVFSGDSGKVLRGIQGDALTAVASRCCFHPNADKLVVVGGNSSGRVTVAR